MTNRIIFLIFLAGGTVGLVVGCSRAKPVNVTATASASTPASNAGNAPVSAPPVAAPGPNLTDAQMDALISDVSAAMRKKHMTNAKDECLTYDIDTESDAYVVNVRENHVAGCGGDPNVAPRLFSVRVDKKSRAMTTDNGTSGTFHAM